jgi:hypothetical protein
VQIEEAKTELSLVRAARTINGIRFDRDRAA